MTPTKIEPHENLIVDIEIHMDVYRALRDAGDVKEAEKALTKAQKATKALRDELDRLADERAEVMAA